MLISNISKPCLSFVSKFSLFLMQLNEGIFLYISVIEFTIELKDFYEPKISEIVSIPCINLTPFLNLKGDPVHYVLLIGFVIM